ncbi:MAG: transposase [bacterium]
MPRRNRCVLPGVACHITQRGVDRRETFSSEEDRQTYLRLLRENLGDAGVGLLGWCLMTNHIHLIAVPAREDSLSVLLRRVHGRYAQYYNARAGRTGHLWQNRFFACVLEPDHLWAALAYVERNPVRAGMVQRAADYRWSSAASHLAGADDSGMLDMEWWRRESPVDWDQLLDAEGLESAASLRACTYSGRPFGSETFVSELAERFGRHWTRGRPRKKQALARPAAEPTDQPTDQWKLF